MFATGGDDGGLYIWHKDSAELLRKIQADRDVVNGISVHSQLPTVATCGIDHDIKIWEFDPDLYMRGKPFSAPVMPGSHYFRFFRTRERSVLTTEEATKAIAEAQTLKDSGNVLYNAKNYTGARERFLEALAKIGFEATTMAMEDELRVLYVSCYNNIAACYLQEKNYERVSYFCEEALKRDPKNPKALYRLGIAKMNLKDFNEAKVELEKALALAPNDSLIKNALAQLKNTRNQYNLREKEKFKQMFLSSPNKDDDKKQEEAIRNSDQSSSDSNTSPDESEEDDVVNQEEEEDEEEDDDEDEDEEDDEEFEADSDATSTVTVTATDNSTSIATDNSTVTATSATDSNTITNSNSNADNPNNSQNDRNRNEMDIERNKQQEIDEY